MKDVSMVLWQSERDSFRQCDNNNDLRHLIPKKKTERKTLSRSRSMTIIMIVCGDYEMVKTEEDSTLPVCVIDKTCFSLKIKIKPNR